MSRFAIRIRCEGTSNAALIELEEDTVDFESDSDEFKVERHAYSGNALKRVTFEHAGERIELLATLPELMSRMDLFRQFRQR